jgi:hypothetical protein
MNILMEENNLNKYFKELKNKNVCIVSAFASGTEKKLEFMLKGVNKVELIVGTINSFSSPSFFDYCSLLESNDINLWVDFGYQNAIHWKLYLIEPDVVIVGSANFTNTGLSLARDTCVLIKDINLFSSYKKEVEKLKSSKNVFNFKDEKFNGMLEQYRISHRKMQASLARVVQFASVKDWLSDESNQLLPVFVWEHLHSKETLKVGYGLINRDNPDLPKDDIRDFFTLKCERSQLIYEQGDVVLCMNNKGEGIDFYSFDRIINVNGTNYMYSYKRKKYLRPFSLGDVKKKIKSSIDEWRDGEKNAFMLDRNKLEKLFMNDLS